MSHDLNAEGGLTMGDESAIEKVRRWTGKIGLNVFLWSIRMNLYQYHAAVYEGECMWRMENGEYDYEPGIDEDENNLFLAGQGRRSEGDE